MTDIAIPEPIDALPPAPQPSDTVEDFNAKAFASLAAQLAMVGQINAASSVTYQNATAANERASSAALSAGSAATQAGVAASAAGVAVDARDEALAYAQAAGASAGVPAPAANSFLQTTADSVPVWGGVPVDANKLDKLGGVANNLSFTYLDLGTIAAGGTATINTATATTHRVQASGALTLVFSNLITGAVSGDFELHCVNFGGKTVTWPAGNWIKSDGSYAAAVGNSGVTWQAAGTDRVLVMIDNGQITYKVMR